MVTALNVAVVIVLLLCAFSYLFDPIKHPILAVMGLGFFIAYIVNLFFIPYWLLFKRKMTLISVMAMVICLPKACDYCPVHFKPSTFKNCIKVLSYNVMCYNMSEQKDKGVNNPIVNYILGSEADIVCIQEGRAQDPLNEEKLKKIYHPKYPYYAAVELGEGIDRLVCMSKFPILSYERLNYESIGNGSMACRLLIEGDTVLLVNNHFESNKLKNEDKEMYAQMLHHPKTKDIKKNSKLLLGKLSEASALRAPQGDFVADYISGSKNVILCGDFNDIILSHTHHVLSKQLNDAFAQAGCGLGNSYNRNGFYFRIDHIMASKNWNVEYCEVDNSISVSDHYPVFCYLQKQQKD